MGSTIQAAADFLVPWAAWSLAAALLAALFLPWIGRSRSVTAALPRLLAPVARRREWAVLVLLASGVLLAADGAGFARGFFRQDDFAFVQDVRAAGSVREYLGMYHNDHSMPVYRAQVWALVAAAGPATDAGSLAAWFNLAGFVSYLALLLSGCWVLVELRASRLAILCFLALLWSWPGWGEFTAGFYTLTVYPQTVALGFAALALLVRDVRQPFTACGPAVATLVAIGGLLVLAGIWLVPVMLLLVVALPAGGPRSRLISRGAWLGAAALVVVGYHAILAPHPLSGRELIQNPSGTLIAASVVDNLREHGWQVAVNFFSGVAGTLLSALVPPVAELLTRHVANPAVGTGVAAAGVLAWVMLAGLAWLGCRKAEKPGRRLLAGLLFAVAVPVAMTALARININALPGVFWPAKYKCIPYCWLALFLALVAQKAFAATTPRRAVASAAVVLLGGGWLTLTHWRLEQRLDLSEPWLPGGRFHNVVLAESRRGDHQRLVGDLASLSRATGSRRLLVPAPDAGTDAYRFLEYGGHALRGSNYAFPDLLAVAPDSGLTLEIVSPGELPAVHRQAMEQHPRLSRLFGVMLERVSAQP